MSTRTMRITHIICSLCGEPIRFTRSKGCSTYEDGPFRVCNDCCTHPISPSHDRVESIRRLLMYIESNPHESTELPFWPKDIAGNIIDISELRKCIAQ